jgi:hypothetical protein
VALRIELLVACLGAMLLAMAIFPVVATALAKFARVELAHVVFGSGTKLFARRVGPTMFELRLVPMQSWIKAVGQGVYQPADHVEPPLRPGRVAWREASRARRVLAFVVAPRLVVFTVAAIGLGLARAGEALARGVAQLVTGAIGPFSTARAILDAGVDILAREGAWVVVAIALAKWVAFSVLTLPGDLAGAMDASEAQGRSIAKVRVALMLLFFAIAASWLLALVAWVAFR